jgi:Mrp family chromosome partitioning ATPase
MSSHPSTKDDTMSSTDKAFIQAYQEVMNESAPLDAKDEATRQRSFTVGTRQFRVTEFVANPASQLNVSEVAMAGAIPVAPQPTEPAPPKIPKPAPVTKEGELELIELRIDPQINSVVPAPHIPASAFHKSASPQAKPARRRPAPQQRPAPTPQPIKPLATPSLNQALSNAASRFDQTPATPPHQANAPRPVLSAFNAAWEVDHFQWPSVCNQLDATRSEPLSNFVRAILADAWQGTKVVAVTQFGRGEGGTTLSLCLARWASMFTGRVALIDGDVMRPRLAESLGLSFGHGWEESSSQLPLSETAVRSISDRLTVLPLGPKSGLLAAESDRELGSSVLLQLADAFELVILDAGPMYDAAYQWFSPAAQQAIGNVLVVQDVRQTSIEQVADVRRRLVDQGLQKVSIVENFRAP